MKAKKYERCISRLSFAKAYSRDQKFYQKIDYRLGAAYNGLGRHKDALNVLEKYKDSKDPLVKVELNKATKALKEENKTTEDQKETFKKMFNPEKRKEEEQKRKDEKKKKDGKEESTKKDGADKGSQLGTIAVLAAAAAGVGFILYKVLRK